MTTTASLSIFDEIFFGKQPSNHPLVDKRTQTIAKQTFTYTNNAKAPKLRMTPNALQFNAILESLSTTNTKEFQDQGFRIISINQEGFEGHVMLHQKNLLGETGSKQIYYALYVKKDQDSKFIIENATVTFDSKLNKITHIGNYYTESSNQMVIDPKRQNPDKTEEILEDVYTNTKPLPDSIFGLTTADISSDGILTNVDHIPYYLFNVVYQFGTSTPPPLFDFPAFDLKEPPIQVDDNEYKDLFEDFQKPKSNQHNDQPLSASLNEVPINLSIHYSQSSRSSDDLTEDSSNDTSSYLDWDDSSIDSGSLSKGKRWISFFDPK